MNTLTNYRLCALITALGGLLVVLGIWMMSGVFSFDPVREGFTLLLLVWLATGSNVARWIVGLLLAGSVLVALGGMVWLAANGLELGRMESRQQGAFIPVALAVALYGFVAWRLLVWPRRFAQTTQEAQQAAS
jgi:hypothetical protein